MNNAQEARADALRMEWNSILSEDKKTLCWRCSELHPFDDSTCPKCGAINANHDLEAAIKQMKELWK